MLMTLILQLLQSLQLHFTILHLQFLSLMSLMIQLLFLFLFQFQFLQHLLFVAPLATQSLQMSGNRTGSKLTTDLKIISSLLSNLLLNHFLSISIAILTLLFPLVVRAALQSLMAMCLVPILSTTVMRVNCLLLNMLT